MTEQTKETEQETKQRYSSAIYLEKQRPMTAMTIRAAIPTSELEDGNELSRLYMTEVCGLWIEGYEISIVQK